jgi:hypothetical protein
MEDAVEQRQIRWARQHRANKLPRQAVRIIGQKRNSPRAVNLFSSRPMNSAIPPTEQIAAATLEAMQQFHPSIPQALGMMAIYALAGVLVAVLGYKLFDLCTPGDLHKEIIENRNVAAAIIGAAIIVGVCILVAASIMG